MVIGLLLLGVGCSALESGREPPRIYRITAPDEPALARRAATLPQPLRLAVHAASPVLDSERIVVTFAENRVSQLRGARWAAPLPHLIEAAVARLLAPTAAREPGAMQHTLAIGIEDFQAEFDRLEDGQRQRVRVTLAVELTDARGRPRAGLRVSRCRVLAERTVSSVVAGLQASLAAALEAALEGIIRPGGPAAVRERTGSPGHCRGW